MVRMKGAENTVPTRRRRAMAAEQERAGVAESTLVGRGWEMATLTAMVDRSIEGRGSVVGVVGPPGIGKTRLADEVTRLAKSRGVEVFSTFCESHATDVPFRVVARLLRDVGRVTGLGDETARTRLRKRFPGSDPEDMLLLDDLLGISDPEVELPKIDADARRRRLVALVDTARLARTQPAIIVVEDVHWIDEVSESVLADFLGVIPQTSSSVLITYRPDYDGALQHVAGAQPIALAPLSVAETSTLVAELLGPDPSAGEIGEIIAGRAAGNPFFAEEITRELAERGVLVGQRGSYACRTDVGEVRVPATVRETIAARIDRLGAGAKHTIAAAAVIGARFSCDQLARLEIDPCVEELINAELIDQVRFTPGAEYGFRHPLIRTAAYDAQRISDRAALHRRLAAGIEACQSGSADRNAALIAAHLGAAGDGHAAYQWHMRAATWATNRDIAAARLSWECARAIADALPADDPSRTALRIAPRTMLCGTAWRVPMDVAGAHFDELRQLCTAAGDKASLAVGAAGLVIDRAYQARIREASRLASEAWALIESVGDATLTVGLYVPLVLGKLQSAEYSEVLRWSERVINLAQGDPVKGNFIIGSPLAHALAARAVARWCLGHPGWSDDMHRAVAMARSADPMSYVQVVGGVYFGGIPGGVITPDDSAVREIEDALRIAERCGDDLALGLALAALGVALVQRQSAAGRDRGQKMLAEVSEVFRRWGHNLCDLPIVEVYLARERARRGDRDGAVPLMRAAVDDLFREGLLLGWGFPATGVLVETLLDRGADADVAEAEVAIDRLARLATDGLMVRDIWLLRLHALLARTRGDAAAYAHLRDRYRDRARTLDLEGHIAWGEAMP
jgi:hypothetical protein